MQAAWKMGDWGRVFGGRESLQGIESFDQVDPCGQVPLDCDQLVVEFIGNGPGPSDDVSTNPFSPFTRTKCWPGGGLRHIGLGLPVARRIVQDHNGKITLRSSEQGVCVSLTLPLHHEDGVARSPA